ncbi:hypothetical protein [Phyllobacterium myrsinacearum]|uniref:Secreted protein n=1 Tax=Phyllobacterium myrsinacearum TaxID=28101 RepID=A0A839EK59_9HYPH|nr:hypothetical protein [Phyllobacterium myrsinacearum]MBA8879252.1 hypothetical protein [Phyllobacterium myrsinacearum]
MIKLGFARIAQVATLSCIALGTAVFAAKAGTIIQDFSKISLQIPIPGPFRSSGCERESEAQSIYLSCRLKSAFWRQLSIYGMTGGSRPELSSQQPAALLRLALIRECHRIKSAASNCTPVQSIKYRNVPGWQLYEAEGKTVHTMTYGFSTGARAVHFRLLANSESEVKNLAASFEKLILPKIIK